MAGRNYQQFRPSYGAPVYSTRAGYRANTVQENGEPPKFTGCKITMGKNDKPVMTGWNKRRGQFMTFVATLNKLKFASKKDGSEITNKKGEVYTRWTATVINHKTMTESLVSCLYNTVTGKLYMPTFNMVANPKARRGGYWGLCKTSKKRKY